MIHFLILLAGLFPKLSDYKTGIPYEVITPLFSDYAEKARTIYIPAGKKMIITDNGLPQFPEGTQLFKTFYYNHQKIETRVLIKTATGWEAGTYVWDNNQQDAYLTTAGAKKTITTPAPIKTYSVPQSRQCSSCHGNGPALQPIGFKARNIAGQFNTFIDAGILEPFDTTRITPLDNGPRAYLDVNCAHCHHANGMCKQSDLRLAYENTLEQSAILKHKKQIVKFMQNGRMPLLGTHVIHREGVAQIAAYIHSLK